MAGQVEATWATLDTQARAHLRQQLERIVTATGFTAVGARLRKLVSTGDHVPYELIEGGDEVGRLLRAAVSASREPAETRIALISLLSLFPVSGKAGKTWKKDAGVVLSGMKEPAALLGTMLDCAIEPPDYVTSHERSHYVTGGNEALLCGLAALAGQEAGAGTAELLPRLRRLALKAITITGGAWGTPRSMRLANCCVNAITGAALPSSVIELLRWLSMILSKAFLLAADSRITDESITRQIARA